MKLKLKIKSYSYKQSSTLTEEVSSNFETFYIYDNVLKLKRINGNKKTLQQRQYGSIGVEI